MSSEGAGDAAPARSCLACRQRGPRDDLIRLVRAPDGFGGPPGGPSVVVVDLKARLPGRGTWVHPDSACLERIEKQPKLLARALRGPVHTDGLTDAVRDAVKQALLHGLSQASAGGHLIGGHDRLIAALHGGGLSWVLLASDAAERTASSVRAAAGEMPVVVVPLDRETLGRQVGQASRAALGVGTTPACAYLRRQLRRWRNLG